MARARLVRGVAVCVAVVAIGACGDSADREPTSAGSGLSLVETLGGVDTTGYARADRQRDFVFPADHGPHPAFRTEWWYVTGNVTAMDGRRFGFQFTIFRSALAPSPPGGPSAWATNQAFMGHFALTDVEGETFRAFEQFARGAAGLAGAGADPLRVWIDDWTLESSSRTTGAGSGTFPLRLFADGGDVSLELELAEGKPRVLQGDEGLSQKGPEPGNASYYYAHTRMPTTGTIVQGGDTLGVEGLSWLDREWSTSALSPGQVGWDWFALQLDDGWDLMVYQLRREDGSADPLSDGVLIDPDGNRYELEWGADILVESTESWASPMDGAVYPAAWRIRVPGRGWDLTVTPVVPDQELRLAFRYWEGAVDVGGVGESGAGVSGRGYVELTGYAEAIPGA